MVVADTSDEARQVQLDFYRSLTGFERVKIAAQMAEDVQAVAVEGIRRRNPSFSEVEITWEFIRLTHGQAIVDQIRASTPNL